MARWSVASEAAPRVCVLVWGEASIYFRFKLARLCRLICLFVCHLVAVAHPVSVCGC